MAIQLNERDYLIFKLLTEHQVLLEKHISWFIATDDKPVLIRDRLRKLFYLDYLLCQRYDNKLPWWTTPTKPLVYMLAPLAKAMCGSKNWESEAIDNQQQQKFLELANIKMIFLIAQKQGVLQNFQWTTCLPAGNGSQLSDAFLTCTSRSASHNLGIFSHPNVDHEFAVRIRQILAQANITNMLIISRDQTHQQYLQNLLTNERSQVHTNKIIFATHQDLYKDSLNKVQWFNVVGEPTDIFNQPTTVPSFLIGETSTFTDMHAA